MRGGKTINWRSHVNKKRIHGSEDLISDGTQESPGSSAAHKRVRWDKRGCRPEVSMEEEDSEEGPAAKEKLCLATTCQSGRVSCAYYDPVKCTLYFCEDTPDNQHYDLTKALLEQCIPDIVITSSKADEAFIDVLRDHMDASAGTFQIRPHKDFSPRKGRDRVLSLQLLYELSADLAQETSLESTSSHGPKNAYDFMKRRRDISGDPMLQRWNASIRLSNYATIEGAPLCLGSIGALLDYLARIRALGELDDDGIGGLEIRAIEAFTPSQSMQINADALFSLQIFEDESHASIHSDKTKEGLSLFGILNNTKTTLGRLLLREWLIRPSLSLSVIKSRHDTVACFLRTDNIVTASSMHGHLQGVKNIPRIIGIMKAGRATVSDWQSIVKFTFHSLMLRDSLSDLSHVSDVHIVQQLNDVLALASFRDMGNMVNETIDWEESTSAGRVCVRPHIDEELDNLKHIYHGIDTVLSKVAQQLSATVPPDYASSLNVVYFPQLGFLICVPMLEEWRSEEGITVLEGWVFQFSSESHVYFKSQEMHDMDAHIGDLHPSIVDREIEIVQSLLEKIIVHAEAMERVCDVCAELDCLLSFAEASRAYNYVRPQMALENVIDIKQGRHPLQELVVDTFVPNDATIIGGAGIDFANENCSSQGSEDKNSIVICTGPNACGKSVYLKQVALIQYMAQIGCFVPAESATLGIVDKVFTRVQTRETVSKVQSAFMIDINQVSLALRNSTERSLILLDEFGKGTISAGSYFMQALFLGGFTLTSAVPEMTTNGFLPRSMLYALIARSSDRLTADGAGLFCGVIKHLALRGSVCPKVLAATHFHDVFTDDLLSPRLLPITFVHMQVMLATRKGQLLAASGSVDDAGFPDMDDTATEENEERKIAPGERITYLYRVAKGLSLESHAALCAEIFGIPRRIANRARYVSKLLSTHELGQLLDEEMNEDERKDLENAEEVCRRFLACDLSPDRVGEGERDVRQILAEVLGRPIDAPLA